MPGFLYLIPCTLGSSTIHEVLPVYNKQVILSIRHFVVENIRSARRFLKATDKAIDIDELSFGELNNHTASNQLRTLLQPALDGKCMGLISEAGCPAIADPGADLVALAHSLHIPVIPLVGPSSIVLALMVSGFNGQNFAFNGYLPIKSPDRKKKLSSLEQKLIRNHQTQLFIETPYRNLSLLEEILDTCNNNIKVCIAANLTLPDAFIAVKTVAQWKQQKELPPIHKKPAIFILGQ